MTRRFTRHTPHSSPLKSKPQGVVAKADPPASKAPAKPVEIGGPSGPEPTRYGDWERKGICVDF